MIFPLLIKTNSDLTDEKLFTDQFPSTVRRRAKSISESVLDLGVCAQFVSDGMGNIVNDSFLACFESNPPPAWYYSLSYYHVIS